MYPIKKTIGCRMMMVILFITASLPLVCNYIMSGGEILLWLARIEEVKEGLRQGSFLLFPSLGVTNEYQGQMKALDSNLLLVIPAAVRMLGGSITAAYRIFMLLIQGATLFFAWIFFKRLFQDQTGAIFGVLFYMTCPYRLYICYDKGDLGQTAVWMILPLLAWGICGMYGIGNSVRHGTGQIYFNMLIASLAFAGIAYSSSAAVMILYAVLTILFIVFRKARLLIPMTAGSLISFPVIGQLAAYLIRGGMQEWNLPMDSISQYGYAPGQFFTTYVYKPGYPGMGLGMMIALFLLLWLVFTENKKIQTPYLYYFIAGILFLAMSLQLFPWDLMQRLGGPIQKAVSYQYTPVLFFGLGISALCIPAAFAINEITRYKRNAITIGLPLIAASAGIATAIYNLSTLMYTRLPLYLADSIK